MSGLCVSSDFDIVVVLPLGSRRGGDVLASVFLLSVCWCLPCCLLDLHGNTTVFHSESFLLIFRCRSGSS